MSSLADPGDTAKAVAIYGTDLAVHQWDEIYAAFGGKVRYARYHSGYGKCIVIRHHNGLEALYAHMNVFIDFSGRRIYADTVVLKQYRHSYSVIPVGNDYHVVKRGDYLQKI